VELRRHVIVKKLLYTCILIAVFDLPLNPNLDLLCIQNWISLIEYLLSQLT